MQPGGGWGGGQDVCLLLKSAIQSCVNDVVFILECMLMNYFFLRKTLHTHERTHMYMRARCTDSNGSGVRVLWVRSIAVSLTSTVGFF